ncbi:uncharacterized protein [Mytilus edulis]|uniref:uncharacterized protein n=1 Tax=Mytilus edulis TaxID=6550 RepID=UPI0039F009E5
MTILKLMRCMQVFGIWIVLYMSETHSVPVDLASPEVFDPVFYSNYYHQVITHSVNSPEAVKQHWLTHGIDAGWQGSGQFHSKEYIARYPDLQKAFGNNYRAAIQHYLTFHNSEHRLGLSTSHHFGGRWTALNHGIYIGSSTRTGGAVDSLTWNNKEFINSRDHGRQMQMACNTNKYTECYNPTEAGGLCDHTLSTTHTHIDWVHVHENVMESLVYPAFWKPVKPSSGTQHDCHYGQWCPAHQGYHTTYDYPFHKKITIGTHGINNCFEFVSNFTIGGNWPQDDLLIQMEAPAVYMTYEFTKQFTFNPATRLAENYHNKHLPFILSTPDHNYALGAYTPQRQDTDIHENYDSHLFKGSNFAGATSKFNIVFYKRPHGTGVRQYVYRTYFCVGTLNDVTSCLHKIMTAVPK